MAEYITKEAAKGAINHNYPGFWAAIDALPVADVAPVVHGRWERCFEDWRKQIEGDKCSSCGFEHYGCSIRHYRFCPNCGAKMDAMEEHGV